MKRNETGSGSGGSGTISGRKDEKVVFFFPAAKKSQENTWLSTFFHFMRGENDEMLETISRCRLSLYYYQVVYVMPGIYEPQQQQYVLYTSKYNVYTYALDPLTIHSIVGVPLTNNYRLR